MTYSSNLNAKKEQNKKREYNGIDSLITKGNYKLALSALDEYLKKYPHNSYATKDYANILRHQGRLDEALSMLEQSDNYSDHILREKGYCYFLKGEYEKAREQLERIRKKDDHIDQAISFCKVKMNDYSEKEIDIKRYSVQQMIHYSEEKALDHLRFHRKKKYGRAYFDENINVEDLFHNIQKVLPNSIQTWNWDLVSQYVYSIDQVGYDSDGLRTNRLSVMTLPNSYEILTMAPSGSKRNVEINDYEGMLQSLLPKEEEEPIKQKVMKRQSQIDKFQKRYGKKYGKK